MFLPRDRYTHGVAAAVAAALRGLRWRGHRLDAMVGSRSWPDCVHRANWTTTAPIVNLEVLDRHLRPDHGHGTTARRSPRGHTRWKCRGTVRPRYGGRSPAGYQATNNPRAAVEDIVAVASCSMMTSPSVRTAAPPRRSPAGTTGHASRIGALSVRCYRRRTADAELGVKLFQVG